MLVTNIALDTSMSAAVMSICKLLYREQDLIFTILICRCEPSTRSVATCGPNHANSWQWGPQGRQCGAARLNTLQARHVLQQKWVVMAGDSITRFLFAALLRLLADDGEFYHAGVQSPCCTENYCIHRINLSNLTVFLDSCASCPKESAQQLSLCLHTRCICK